MEIIGSPITIIGLSAELILFLAGGLLFAGIFSLSKVIPPKHPVNRQAGKGLLIQLGATLGYNLVNIFAGDWNGWITFLISVLCIVIMFLGLRVFWSAMKELNKVARQRNSHTNT